MMTLSINKNNNCATQYIGADFDSAITLCGDVLVARADGLFLVGGDSDGGDEISAQITLPTKDFGDSAQKRIRSAHVDYDSDGEIALTFIFDDNLAFTKMVGSSSGRPASAKVDGTRAAYGRNISVKIENIGGCDFSLNALEIFIVKNSRRSR